MKPTQPYEIYSNDRITAVGKTGSGKTAAILALVWAVFDRVSFFDVKGTEHKEKNLQYPVLRTVDDVQQALFAEDPDNRLDKFVICLKRPTLDKFDRVCRLHFERGNCHLIADELKKIYHGSGLTDAHNDILTNGRSRGVGMTGTSQRPMRIPREQLSETEHLFVFLLKDPDDADRVDSLTAGRLPVEPVSLDRYHYIYNHDYLDQPAHHEPLDL
jgi:hypothetical protein